MRGECVRCGYCCRKGPCAFWGEVDESQGSFGACIHLVEEDDVAPGVPIYSCARYEEIKAHEKHDQYPMFGCGCSSTVYNTFREAVIKAQE